MEYKNSILTYSSSLEVIDPTTLFTDGYELSNQTLIESKDYQGSFTPGVNNCEFYVYDANKTLITSDYNYAGLTVPNNPKPIFVTDPKTGVKSVKTTTINLTPESDVVRAGFTFGKMYAVYNFVNLELGSSIGVPYYLAEISSDRTEIRLKSNFIPTRTMKSTIVALKNNIANPQFFDEIYISFGNNEYHIGVNAKYDDSVINQETNTGPVQASNAIGQASILIKLYDPLPSKYGLLDELYVATKTAESKAYLVNFENDFKDSDNIIRLKGPNSNLKINDFVNNSSINKNKTELLGTKSTGSKDQLLNVLNQRGVQITPNYTTASFGEFVNFSSAKSQVSNFIEKVSRIQTYEADLNIISRTTASNVGNVFVSESIASIFTKIQHEITAFSGFEYYQYYSTGSDAYPKTGSTFPFELLPTQSLLANNWIAAAEKSGSLFDGDNQNWLYYTIPEFIKENNNNDNYLEFTNMVGQSFDEVWLYTKAVAEKSNTTNQLDKGIPLQLADDVITSLGYTGFGNNYNNQDNFFGLIGSDNGDLLPPTGSEMISHQIAVNGPGGVINYWEDSYTDLDYVDVEKAAGFPYPMDKVSKEIFKRLYHNMSYLVKKKGTVSGLRQLINIWGIPNTILRINEFGGKNKDEEDDYDLWYQRYSYAYSPVPPNTNYASSSVRIPWQPLYRNYIHSHNQLLSTSEIAAVGGPITGGSNGVSNSYGIDTQFTVTGGGSGGTLTITAAGGNVTKVILTQGDSGGYKVGSVITITGTQINNLTDPQLGSGWSGTSTFTITAANLGAEQIVPDGLGFRFKTTGYPSSSFGGAFDSQSLFIKKSTNNANDADFGIALYYTGSTSGSHLGSTSSAYKDYGEMRFFIKGDNSDGGTVMSDPIYLPFFDKGWWNVQLQRDQHPIVSNNSIPTTYTMYVGNKIYDGADGNQIGFTGSVSISSQPGGQPLSQSINKSWNDFSIDLAQYGAGGYLGGWGNTLTAGTTGSIGTTSTEGVKGVQNAGKNFSGSLQEFRYYSHDISQSVFNDAVMNPESIEGNNITGSESSFDIINFRAPLGNELESRFTSSFNNEFIDQVPSVHPAVSGSSPLIITASFYNPATVLITSPSSLTSSYDVTYNANSSLRTYSTTNVETYFLDQPSIGIRNRVSNKIKYSSNLNFGNTLSNRVSIQQNPPISQSYTDNINSLEVAFSPTEEVNDDIIQSLGYGSIQEVIADPRFRSSSDDYYPGLRAISDDYFKKYTNRSQIDYLRLIRYFDDSLFKAIKNYVPARTSVSTGIVIKQHMLERNRYREPQVDIVTTQSYAPFNQPLTTKNLELTGSVNTNQLWDSKKQTTYYSSSDLFGFNAGPGGSVNQYNVLKEGGGLFALENDDLSLITKGAITLNTVIDNTSGLLTNPACTTVGTITGIPGNGTFTKNGIPTTRGTGAEFSITSTTSSGITQITSVECTTIGSGYVNGDEIVISAATITAASGLGTVITDLRFRVSGVVFTSIFEAEPLEDVGKDIILVNANDLQSQGTATIRFGSNTSQTTTPGNADADHSITIITINPSDGSTITKSYCTSNTADTGTVDGGFIRFRATGNATAKAAQFIDAINSVNGQGSGAATPTLTAIVDPSLQTQVILTQLYGGTDGNTLITYGSLINTSIGKPTFVSLPTPGSGYAINQSITLSPTTATSGIGTGLTVSATTDGSGVIDGIGTPGGGTVINYAVGDKFSITNLLPNAGNGRGEVSTLSKMLDTTPSSFTGGSAIFKNTFLNALKSVQTPIYVDYNFETVPAPSVAITIEASSSIRGIVYNNTTTYPTPPESPVLNPPGSILVDPQGKKQYLDIHPGEDVFISINSVPNITIDDYQIILGESIIITTALAAETTAASTTLLIDNFSDDTIPPVGSLVTGPEVKAGVVSNLGAVETAGTGYDPSTVQVLATTGAGGGNLTLTVTTNASGNVTTAALSNPGTGYSTNDIVTIVGGDNNATVAITVATPKAVLVDDFDTTNNQVTFNSIQTITDNSRLTFTTTAIPNADTIPVSQQGYFVNNVTQEGIDVSWDDTQEQFYDGEYSGSKVIVDQYFQNQYNPYRKVKANSLPIAETTVTVNTANGGPTVTENPSNAMTVDNFGAGRTDIRFAFASAGEQVGVYPGITNLELIPYQTYEVEFTLNFQTGGGTYAGIFYENYGYNNSLYGLYPQTVSLGLGTIISGTNTGYFLNNNVATTPPGTRLPTVVGGTSGTGYPASSTFIAGTFPKDGAGQTLSVTTNGSGVITGVTLVEPGSGYLVDASGNPTVLTVVGGNNDGLINAGAGGVVVDITEVDATGAIQTGGITAVNGGNGLYQLGDVITITGGDGTATFQARGISSIASNGVELLGSGLKQANNSNEFIKFRFQFLPPLSADTSERGRYGLSFYCLNNPSVATLGTITGLKVTGIGGIYENVEAPIFLTQQDEGYDNQKDYQNMGSKDILGNTISPINLIQNTQSVIFNNADYNPLNNNVDINRSSSNRYVLSYGTQQYIPSNFDLIVTQAYFPTSPSGTFPELADVPDSNYTMPGSVNARYNGTKLKSLNYNFFTPSGSVGPEVELPIMPVNRSKNPIGFRVANEFIDGSLTSSFDQTTLGAGSASWEGDSRQNKGSSTIDKHPIYMARFENSYEQLNLYDSYQFNIDQLIEVPFADIAGIEVTPNSIVIDGSNQNKKVVSSVFEPKRKVSVSYLNPKTPNIDYTTMTIGNFDILSGATEFLTINSNAKSRVSGSRRYQYELGGSPYTASAFQTEDTIQMVTGSNTIPKPGSVGNFATNATLTKTNSPTVTNGFSGTIEGIPVQSTSGGTGATVDIVFANGAISSITINQEGSGYTVGGSIFIDQGDINAAL